MSLDLRWPALMRIASSKRWNGGAPRCLWLTDNDFADLQYGINVRVVGDVG